MIDCYNCGEVSRQRSSHFTYISGEWWGANENCVELKNATENDFLKLDRCRPHLNITTHCTYTQTSSQQVSISSYVIYIHIFVHTYNFVLSQFWERYVLNITDGLGEPGDLGGFKYDLPLALLLSWIVVFLCLMKGVKSSGKVIALLNAQHYLINSL